MSPPAAPPPATVATTASSSVTVLALALATFLSLLSVISLVPFLPVMAESFGVSVSVMGQVPATITLVAAGLGLAIGPLADWLGYRRAILLGLVALIVSTVGIALSNGLAALLAVAFIGAIGRATISPVCQAMVGARYAGETRRRAQSWIVAGASGAGIIGIPLLTGIDANLGWRAAFGGLALLIAISLVLVLMVVAPDATAVSGWPQLRTLLRSYTPLLAHRPTLGLIGATVLASTGCWTMFIYLGAFVIQQHGFTTVQAGWAYMLVSLGVLPGTFAAGGWLGRLPSHGLLIGSRLATGVLIALALILPLSGAVAVALLAGSLFFYGVAVVTTVTLLSSETPGGRATTMVLNQSAVSLGTALAGVTGGLVLALSGYAAMGACGLLWCIASAGLIWWSRLPRSPAVALGESPGR